MREKNFSPEFRSYSTRGRKFRKKIAKKFKKLKTTFWRYFKHKGDEIGRERESRILASKSAHSRPGGENYEKNSKKNKKQLSGVIFSQNGMKYAEKERKEF